MFLTFCHFDIVITKINLSITSFNCHFIHQCNEFQVVVLDSGNLSKFILVFSEPDEHEIQHSIEKVFNWLKTSGSELEDEDLLV